jgi:hypothetical protein
MVLQSIDPLWILDPSYKTHFPATSLKVQFAGVSAKMAGTTIAINHKTCIATGTNKETFVWSMYRVVVKWNHCLVLNCILCLVLKWNLRLTLNWSL